MTAPEKERRERAVRYWIGVDVPRAGDFGYATVLDTKTGTTIWSGRFTHDDTRSRNWWTRRNGHDRRERMTRPDTDAIRKRLEADGGGAREVYRCGYEETGLACGFDGRSRDESKDECYHPMTLGEAELYANAPADLAALLAYVAELEASIESMPEHMSMSACEKCWENLCTCGFEWNRVYSARALPVLDHLMAKVAAMQGRAIPPYLPQRPLGIFRFVREPK